MQWSPTECSVFASCSVDRNIAIWDIRVGKSPAASFKAHNADVNVMSWNRCSYTIHLSFSFRFIEFRVTLYNLVLHLALIRLASCMLASGSDDGTFSIRDLRLLGVCPASCIIFNCLKLA